MSRRSRVNPFGAAAWMLRRRALNSDEGSAELTSNAARFTDITKATPPVGDPIYIEMIGTLGLSCTSYMSKEDMEFCSMRLYCNFKCAQENEERHAMLDSIDVVPDIYDILRLCDDSLLTADEKSLLATQLAPHWTNAMELRKALEAAVVYKGQEEETEFWQRCQEATDALSRYDQVIVLARIVLLFDGSSDQSAAIRQAAPLFLQVLKVVRTKCPQWHEGNVQLMGVYITITFLEYAVASQTLGTDTQSSALDWVHALGPDDLEKFLAEKKEQRMRVLSLDLEPTGIAPQSLLEHEHSPPPNTAETELPLKEVDDDDALPMDHVTDSTDVGAAAVPTTAVAAKAPASAEESRVLPSPVGVTAPATDNNLVKEVGVRPRIVRFFGIKRRSRLRSNAAAAVPAAAGANDGAEPIAGADSMPTHTGLNSSASGKGTELLFRVQVASFEGLDALTRGNHETMEQVRQFIEAPPSTGAFSTKLSATDKLRELEMLVKTANDLGEMVSRHVEDKDMRQKELVMSLGSKAYYTAVRTGICNAYLAASVVGSSLVCTSKSGSLGTAGKALKLLAGAIPVVGGLAGFAAAAVIAGDRYVQTRRLVKVADMASDAVECSILARRLALRLTDGLADCSISNPYTAEHLGGCGWSADTGAMPDGANDEAVMEWFIENVASYESNDSDARRRTPAVQARRKLGKRHLKTILQAVGGDCLEGTHSVERKVDILVRLVLPGAECKAGSKAGGTHGHTSPTTSSAHPASKQSSSAANPPADRGKAAGREIDMAGSSSGGTHQQTSHTTSSAHPVSKPSSSAANPPADRGKAVGREIDMAGSSSGGTHQQTSHTTSSVHPASKPKPSSSAANPPADRGKDAGREIDKAGSDLGGTHEQTSHTTSSAHPVSKPSSSAANPPADRGKDAGREIDIAGSSSGGMHEQTSHTTSSAHPAPKPSSSATNPPADHAKDAGREIDMAGSTSGGTHEQTSHTTSSAHPASKPSSSAANPPADRGKDTGREIDVAAVIAQLEAVQIGLEASVAKNAELEARLEVSNAQKARMEAEIKTMKKQMKMKSQPDDGWVPSGGGHALKQRAAVSEAADGFLEKAQEKALAGDHPVTQDQQRQVVAHQEELFSEHDEQLREHAADIRRLQRGVDKNARQLVAAGEHAAALDQLRELAVFVEQQKEINREHDGLLLEQGADISRLQRKQNKSKDQEGRR